MSRRLLALALVALLLAAWAALRPANRDARLLEFPAALLLVALALAFAARAPRPETPALPLRRHEQVVRALPDPETRPLREALDAWVATGARADEAAGILARAAGAPVDISHASTRRKREAILRRVTT